MKRFLLSFTLIFLTYTVPVISNAQYSERAYAPENIGSISVRDQIRVIEKEYRDQSRGVSNRISLLHCAATQVTAGFLRPAITGINRASSAPAKTIDTASAVPRSVTGHVLSRTFPIPDASKDRTGVRGKVWSGSTGVAEAGLWIRGMAGAEV